MSTCWSANIVGAFFVALIALDTFNGNYGDLPYHAIIGIITTCLFWLICTILGGWVSAAILFVPAIFLVAILINTAVNKTDDDDCECNSCKTKKFILRFKKKPQCLEGLNIHR
jgi:uncharacterized membrane protein